MLPLALLHLDSFGHLNHQLKKLLHFCYFKEATYVSRTELDQLIKEYSLFRYQENLKYEHLFNEGIVLSPKEFSGKFMIQQPRQYMSHLDAYVHQKENRLK